MVRLARGCLTGALLSFEGVIDTDNWRRKGKGNSPTLARCTNSAATLAHA